MRAVSLQEARERLDELIEIVLQGEDVLVDVNEDQTVMLTPITVGKRRTPEEKAVRREAILELVRQVQAMPVLDPRTTEEILDDEYGEDGVFGETNRYR